MFTLHNESSQLIAYLVCHVGDVLFTGTGNGVADTGKVLRTFRAGDTEKLSAKENITPTGMLMERGAGSPWDIILSQHHYAMDLQCIGQFATHGSIKGASKLRTVFRQALGALIWLRQTRPDIGYDIAKIATVDVEAFQDAGKALPIMQLYNKTVRFVKNYSREIHYSPLGPVAETFGGKLKRLAQLRLVAFTDAGFGALTGSRPIEGSVTLLAEVLPRDGTIECHGSLLDHRCAKIQRA